MYFIHLFTGFDGRINRRWFWIGFLILFAVETGLLLALGIPLVPTAPMPFSMRLTGFLIEVATLYPTAALMVKRLHDRNQPGIYVAWLLVPVANLVTNLLGLTGDPAHLNWADWVLGLLAGFICLVFLVELGFRRGTTGANRFGPDPHASAAERAGGDTR